MTRLPGEESMIETLSFALGVGFSLLVHFYSIRRSPFSSQRKFLYSLLSFIGITGMLWLSGVLLAHFWERTRTLF